MARVNVFLQDELLDEIDRLAKEDETNLSALIQTALEEYLQAKRKNREEEEKRKQMQKASCRIDELAKKLGQWDATAIIRRFRDTNLKGE